MTFAKEKVNCFDQIKDEYLFEEEEKDELNL
jgi:hypothetical protein